MLAACAQDAAAAAAAAREARELRAALMRAALMRPTPDGDEAGAAATGEALFEGDASSMFGSSSDGGGSESTGRRGRYHPLGAAFDGGSS